MPQDGGPAHARQFLRGCALPAAWAGQAQWRILATGFDRGLSFLATWRAWKDDPERPRILHFVAIAANADAAAELMRAADPWPDLLPLARDFERECYGLLPGVHRLVFEQGHVLLTLWVGDTEKMLRQQDVQADSVFLQAAPAVNLKAVARCCRRGTRIAAVDDGSKIRSALTRHGFSLHATEDTNAGELSPVVGEFAPTWEPRGPRPMPAVVPGECIVIGAGLAGAAAAASLARRGWSVTVLDAAARAASGASGLPAGLLVPHSSPDDNLLSRLSRDGVRATLQQAQALLQAGVDWAPSGVLEHLLDEIPTPVVAVSSAQAQVWSRLAGAMAKQLARLGIEARADWHEKGAWIRPAALVAAWLAQPGVVLRTDAQVARLERDGPRWQARDVAGDVLASGDLVIVAAALGSSDLVEGAALQGVRGQVSWAVNHGNVALPPFPVNGDGGFIPGLPTPRGPAWLCGSSFDRDDLDLTPRDADQQANLARLRRLLPAVANEIEATLQPGQLQAWTGIRCASSDRRPLAGQLDPVGQNGVWLSTAMGSRGLTFAVLCAEMIAARVHGEPLPLARKLADALSANRSKLPARPRQPS